MAVSAGERPAERCRAKTTEQSRKLKGSNNNAQE
jgi:hypothetical protein